MKEESVATVKISGDADLVQEIANQLSYNFRALTNSGLRRNDRDLGSHLFLTLVPKEARDR